MKDILRLLRPHQYLKNSFVFIGPLFAHRWDAETLTQALLVFVAFSLISSAVYVLNDIVDIESDRLHPTKRNRPLASGDVSTGTAKVVAAVLLIFSILVSWAISLWALALIATYFVLNAIYSWKVKNVPILDVFFIAAGFMLRIFAGTLGLGIPPSDWLVLCGLMITLFLGFAKRRAEVDWLLNRGSKNKGARKVLTSYNTSMLDQFIAITGACTVISYGLYTVDPHTESLHQTDKMIYTVIFVAYGIFRYIFLVHHKDKGHDTTRDIVQDPHIMAASIAWLAASLWAIS